MLAVKGLSMEKWLCWGSMGAAGLLLLITCFNVANLLIVRGLARGRELAVRAALGADQGRLIGQLLTESAIIASVGGLVGAALAYLSWNADDGMTARS